MCGNCLEVDKLWRLYQDGLTCEQLAANFGVSSSTIKRRLKKVRSDDVEPNLSGGVVQIDVTYWGRNKGLILALDAESGMVLYFKWINHETKQDYIDALDSISNTGYKIEAVVLDGGVGLDMCKQIHVVQMCQFHFIAIIRRKLTLRPKLDASKELWHLAKSVTTMSKEEFSEKFKSWSDKWSEFLKEKTINPQTKRWQYTHRSLRSAAQTFKGKIPFLFAFQEYPNLKIPRTNNKVESLFGALKSALHNHNGMSQANKERFVVGFFRHKGYRPNDPEQAKKKGE